jgi:hypothetical protein
MDGIDISSWLGKPPENEKADDHAGKETESQGSRGSDIESAVSAPSVTSSGDDIQHIDENPIPVSDDGHGSPADEHSSDDELVTSIVTCIQQGLYVDVPKLSEEEKEGYEHLPGHYSVQKVLAKLKGDKYVVRLKNEEKDLVSALTCP